MKTRRRSVYVAPSSAGAGSTTALGQRRASVAFRPGFTFGSPAPEDVTPTALTSTPKKQASVNPLAMHTMLVSGIPITDRLNETTMSNSAIHDNKTTPAAGIQVENTDDGYTVTITNNQQRSRHDVGWYGSDLSPHQGLSTGVGHKLQQMANSLVCGYNVALLHLGTHSPTSATAPTLPGPTVSIVPSFIFPSGGQSPSLLSALVTQVLNILQEKQGNAQDAMATEILVSMVATTDGRYCDLLAVDPVVAESSSVTYERFPVVHNVITGPRLVGVSYKKVKTAADWERYMTTAAQIAARSKRTPIIITSLLLKQQKVSDASFHSDEPFATSTGDTDAVLSSLMAVDFLDRPNIATKALECTLQSELQHVLQGAIGGNCITTCVATLDRYDPVVALGLLGYLSKAATVVNSPPKLGSVTQASTEVREQLTPLRDRLELVPGLDAATRKRMEKEVTVKEQTLRELEEHLHRAAETVSMSQQISRMSQNQRVNEDETKRALSMLDAEKKRRFAQAFRHAFKKQQALALSSSEVQALQRTIAQLQRDNAALTNQRDGLQEERDGLLRHSEMQANDIKLEKHQRSLMELQVSKSKRIAQDHEATMIELETEVRRLRNASNQSSAKVLVDLANAKLQIDQLTMRLAAMTTQYQSAQADADRLRDQLNNATFQESANLRDRITTLEVEYRSLGDILAFRDESIEDLKQRLDVTQERHQDLQARHLEEVRSNAALKDELHNRVMELRNKYVIERDAYIDMLHEGQCYVDEVKHLVDMQFDERPSAYRGDRIAVASWLGAVGGLESLASTMYNHGFDTMHAVSLLREDDLVKMQCTAGTRRKIMHAVAELATMYEGVLKNSVALFRTPESAAGNEANGHGTTTSTTMKLWNNQEINDHLAANVSLRTLTSDMEAWILDFRAAIDAEVEMSSAFVASCV